MADVKVISTDGRKGTLIESDSDKHTVKREDGKIEVVPKPVEIITINGVKVK